MRLQHNWENNPLLRRCVSFISLCLWMLHYHFSPFFPLFYYGDTPGDSVTFLCVSLEMADGAVGDADVSVRGPSP